MTKVRISVLVPTYRRPKDLERCLAAIGAQSRPADQIIVVRRESDVETEALLATLEHLPRLHIALVDEPGVVAALNVGLDRADGDIISFTDDDAAPRPDWLETIERHFINRADVGGVGGRDYIPGTTQADEDRVGTFQWFGRAIHNHHIGRGEARLVDFLKGANMSFRATALSGIRFDRRLRGSGAQVHNELMLSFEVRRNGWHLLYDPAVAVDHYPAPRHDEDARHRPTLNAVYDSAFNETLSILEHFPLPNQITFLLFSLLFGTHDLPGLGQCIRLSRRRPGIWFRAPYVIRARIAALAAIRR